MKNKQLIDIFNKIVTRRCLYMKDILQKLLLREFNNVIEFGQFLCAFVHTNLRNRLTNLSVLVFLYLFYFNTFINILFSFYNRYVTRLNFYFVLYLSCAELTFIYLMCGILKELLDEP